MMLATWKPHSGELSQADTAANMHFLQVSNDYINLSLSINELVGGIQLSAEQIKYCYRKEASFYFVSPSMQQFLLWCQVPFIHSLIHSFNHKHFLNIDSAPGPVLSQRHGNGPSIYLPSRGLQSTGRRFYLISSDASGKARVRELVQH